MRPEWRCLLILTQYSIIFASAWEIEPICSCLQQNLDNIQDRLMYQVLFVPLWCPMEFISNKIENNHMPLTRLSHSPLNWGFPLARSSTECRKWSQMQDSGWVSSSKLRYRMPRPFSSSRLSTCTFQSLLPSRLWNMLTVLIIWSTMWNSQPSIIVGIASLKWPF